VARLIKTEKEVEGRYEEQWVESVGGTAGSPTSPPPKMQTRQPRNGSAGQSPAPPKGIDEWQG
jgi:hypothetical protein